ncbi:MAG: hypothetical protein WD431_26245 [Cyclobacteriaceae bacterium]
MKAVKKFTSFDQLKSDESRIAKDSSSLKRHNEFEKVIKNIRSEKRLQANQTKPEQ